MNIIKKINNYIYDKEFKLIITDNYINIINYEEINNFTINEIIIKCHNNIITIEGENLLITKMLKDEVLIKGTITNISIK